MNETREIERMSIALSPGRWQELAARVLDGYRLTPAEGLAILRAYDEELLDLLAAAYRVRRQWFGNRVELNFLINAKSGLCGEDCGYCSQSRVSKAEIPRYNLVTAEEILDGARMAAERHAKTYCAVTSGRAPTDAELDTLSQVVPQVKTAYGLRVCFSVGLLTLEQARRLKACGVDRINHNLNASRRFYPRICTTHTYDDRLDTLRAVRAAGLEICSGGIVGMGEEDADVVDLALELGQLRVEAVPVNFPLPIPGTSLEGVGAAQSALLSEGALPVSAGQSALRVADCRRTRVAPWPVAAVGPLPGQFDLRGRLPYRQGPAARRGLSHDRGDGVRSGKGMKICRVRETHQPHLHVVRFTHPTASYSAATSGHVSRTAATIVSANRTASCASSSDKNRSIS